MTTAPSEASPQAGDSQDSTFEGRPRRRSWRLALRESTWAKACWSVGDQAVVSGANFVTSVLIGKVCGKPELGVFSLALSVTLLARGVQEQVVFAPYMVYCHRRRGLALRAYTGSVWVHHGLLTVAAVLAALVVAAVAGWRDPAVRGALFVSTVAMAPILLRNFARQWALARLELFTVMVVDCCATMIQIGGLAALAVLGGLSAPRAMGVVGAATLVAGGGWWWASRGAMRIVGGHVLPDWRHNWVFARWALVSHLLGTTAPIVLPWVLAGAAGKEATGMFSACMTIVGIPWVFLGGLSSLMVPRAARAMARGGRATLGRTLLVNAVMLAAPASLFLVTMLFAADPVVTLIYGDEFQGAGPVVVCLSCWMLLNGLGMVAGGGLWALERPGANLRADIVTFVATLATTGALVGHWGAFAAALGMACGAAVGVCVRIVTLLTLLRESTAKERSS